MHNPALTIESRKWSEYLTKRFAAATYGLIVLNVAIFIGSRADPNVIFAKYGVVPAHLSLLSMFTSMFIHSDILHLVVNMALLWLFGRSVEFAMGGVEYLIFYVGSGFAAAIVHIAIIATFALDPNVPAVGASGAIAGVLGVFAIRFYRMKFRVGKVEIPALLVLFGWLLLQAVLGFVSLWITNYSVLTVQVNFRAVGYWSHIGGFVFGMVVAQFTRMDVQGQKDYLMHKIHEKLEHGTLLDAARCCEELVHFGPDDPDALAESGYVWAVLGDSEQSVPYYQKAVTRYLQLGRGDEAWRRFREMRAFWPGTSVDPSILYRMTTYLEEIGKYSQAAEVLTRLADLYPDTVEAQMALLKAGHIQLKRLNDPNKANDIFQRLLKEYPHSDWTPLAEQYLLPNTQRPASSTGSPSPNT